MQSDNLAADIGQYRKSGHRAPAMQASSVYGHYQVPFPLYHATIPTRQGPTFQLERGDVTLTIRQQPKEALVCQDGKEKARKPVDPPPIIQLSVRAGADPQQHFMQSPYLFMCCSLWDELEDHPNASKGDNALAGTVVSSLHRLKDTNNEDGGFFVFGDISVKVLGTHRLRFSLFDLLKPSNEVVFLCAVLSQPFKVVPPKDFKGMEESTYLSRAFSDQGVRLRLRKEPRTMMSGNKRPYYAESQKAAQDNQGAVTTSAPYQGTVTTSAPYQGAVANSTPYQAGSYHSSNPYGQIMSGGKRPYFGESQKAQDTQGAVTTSAPYQGAVTNSTPYQAGSYQASNAYAQHGVHPDGEPHNKRARHGNDTVPYSSPPVRTPTNWNTLGYGFGHHHLPVLPPDDFADISRMFQ